MPHLGMEFLGGFRVTLDGVPVTGLSPIKYAPCWHIW